MYSLIHFSIMSASRLHYFKWFMHKKIIFVELQELESILKAFFFKTKIGIVNKQHYK